MTLPTLKIDRHKTQRLDVADDDERLEPPHAIVRGEQTLRQLVVIRDGVAFYLRRDLGVRYELELQRTRVDLVDKRVRLVGTLVAAAIVAADGIAPA